MTKSIANCMQPGTGSADYTLVIKQPLFSKARPRLARSGVAYMPAPYKEAQAKMRKQIKEQWTEGPLEGPISLAIFVKGEGRGDTDNIAGAFMDVAQGIVFTDDRVSVIPKLSIEWQKSSKANSEWIVEIRLL